MHQERMLNSSSPPPPPSSSSSSSLISSQDLYKPESISASSSSSSSSSYNPLFSNHHLQQPFQFHPTLLHNPLPHYYHLHHLHAHPSVDSAHNLLSHRSLDSTHRLYSLPQASIFADSVDSGAANGNAHEGLNGYRHTIDPHWQAPKCYTTDCSPRSVIRHVQSTSSAPSPDPSRPNCFYTNPSTNAGTSPTTAPLHQATDPYLTRPHHSTLHDTKQGALLHVHEQSAALDRDRHLPPPWSSPTAIHHHYYDVCSNINIPSTHSGHEAGTEVGKRGEMRKSPKYLERAASRSADLQKQRRIEELKSGYFSGSAVDSRPCMIISTDRAGYRSSEQRKPTPASSRTEQGNFNVNVNKCTAAKPMYKSMPNSLQIDPAHKPNAGKSFSCDLHNSKYGTKCTNSCTPLRQCAGGMNQAGDVIYKMHGLAPRSPDALLNYGNQFADDDGYYDAKGYAQLGSKWEDAEKWVRPANCHHASGCRGFTNLGLLRMSNCINAGTAIKSHHIQYSNNAHMRPASANSNCASNYSSDFSSSNCTKYSPNGYFSDSNSARLCAPQKSLINQPPLARQTIHVDCFEPHLARLSSNSDSTYARPFSTDSPQLATKQHIKEPLHKQRTDDEQNFQEKYTEKARQKHSASSGFGPSMASKLATDNVHVHRCGLHSQQIQASNREASCASAWNVAPLPQCFCTSLLFTDRFASGEVMSCAPTHSRYMNENSMTMPTMQGSVPMPMVFLKEVGTQMSSIDGSGSISRFTSKNGSPQKPISPTRHNTPAHMRSLNGSTNSNNNMREGDNKAIDLEELVECHRAKLELQALSEGERIHSFHRTTSNWSSKEMEEADLSRSLRHSANDDEHPKTKNHPWPSQSYSWNKDEESKLAKLQLKEAKIQAWEEKKKSKAEAQLKRLEESLAKKRSQTTNRILGSLGAAQRKAEEMRASMYTQPKRATKKVHRFRHRSLSPISRCICFSPSQ